MEGVVRTDTIRQSAGWQQCCFPNKPSQSISRRLIYIARATVLLFLRAPLQSQLAMKGEEEEHPFLAVDDVHQSRTLRKVTRPLADLRPEDVDRWTLLPPLEIRITLLKFLPEGMR